MLHISELNVYYGESHILRDVDLNINAGEMVCLIGRNGVGKTTLLKTLMGILKPRAGTINYEQENLINKTSDQRARLGLGYVPQGRDIIPRLTVKENLTLGLEALPTKRKNATIPEEIFDLFPVLKTMLSRMGGDLSGGQQQQLAIARALVGEPKLLILDEPTEGIQPSIILEIEAAVRRIVASKGIAVLLVEQHLHFGGIVASGFTSELSQEVIQRFLAV
ncbi:MAG: urea ABC transporter ATP-binding subunit UrtE [Microcystis sp. 53602_E8]|nr:urea ABC transporter ATP-binding subunit UrtE [Microcystis sp. 53602_E8]